MKIKAICENCNEYLKEFNESFSLDPFFYEQYKTKHCKEDSVDDDDNKISCLSIYAKTLDYFSRTPHIKRD